MKLDTDRLNYWFQFVGTMTEREIKARYKNAVLGFLWIVINPILQMVVIGFIFQYLIPVNIDNYFMFLFSGLVLWNFFSYTVPKATPSFYYERFLIKKAQFPREAIPLSIIFSNLFHFGISLVLFLIVAVWMQGSNLPSFFLSLPLLLPAIFLVLILVTGFSLLTATLNVFWRDISFIVQALMPLWFYATPIIYTLDILPASIRPLFWLNPMVLPTLLFQLVFTHHGSEFLTLPLILLNVGITLLILGIGVIAYVRLNKSFDDWL